MSARSVLEAHLDMKIEGECMAWVICVCILKNEGNSVCIIK